VIFFEVIQKALLETRSAGNRYGYELFVFFGCKGILISG